MQFLLHFSEDNAPTETELAASHLFNELGLFHKTIAHIPSQIHYPQIICYFADEIAAKGIHFLGRFDKQLVQIEQEIANQNSVPVEFDCAIVNDSLKVNGNLLAWIYFVISHGEERIITGHLRDHHNRVPYSNSVARIQNWLEKPKISEIIAQFGKTLELYCQAIKRHLFVKKPWPNDHKQAVIISHDIDILDKWLLYAGKLAFEHLSKRQFRAVSRIITASFTNILTQRNPTRNIKWILDIERAFGFVSSWHFLVGKVGLRSLLRSDITYDLDEVKKLLPQLSVNTIEIALHSSYLTPDHLEMFGDQIDQLSATVKRVITGVRAHFLRFNGSSYLTGAEKAGIKWDSSNGFAEISGFRTGFTGPFKPVSNNQLIGLWELPLHWMDRSYSKYKAKPVSEIFEHFKSITDQFLAYGGLFTLLWHNYSVSDLGFLGYEKLYEEMLSYLEKNGFYNDTPQNIVDWLNCRESTSLDISDNLCSIKGVDKSIQLDKSFEMDRAEKLAIDCNGLKISRLPLLG